MPKNNGSLNFKNGLALIIGVGYDLPATVKDATAVANALKDPKIAAYKEENVTLLTEKDATAPSILKALDNLIAKSKKIPDAVVFIYFSGHGEKFTDPETNREAYYLKGYEYDDYDRENTMINGVVLAEKIGMINSPRMVIFLDSCHADGMNNEREFIATPASRDLVGILPQGQGRIFMSSCDDGEKSLILKGADHSLFTSCLLEGIAGLNSGKDPQVHAIDILAHILDQVDKKLAGMNGLAQTPVISELKKLDSKFFVCMNSQRHNKSGGHGFATSLEEKESFVKNNAAIQNQINIGTNYGTQTFNFN